MTTPPSDNANVARLRALFALDKLSPDVLSAVIADGDLVSNLNLTATAQPLQLAPDVTVARDDLFAAFAAAAEGGSVKVAVVDRGNPAEAAVSLNSEGAALVETAHLRVQFAHAALWTTDPERRRAALAGELQRHTLTQGSIAQLKELVVAEPAQSYESFQMATDMLNASPEVVAAMLDAKLPGGRLAEGDLLPEDTRYWDNLTAEWRASRSLVEFIETELRAERVSRRGAQEQLAHASMSLQFAGQELVPHDWLVQWHVDEVIRLVEFLGGCEDHISLSAGFEICARQLARDTRFAVLGEQMLERLFADPDVLLVRCQRFAAAFVLATARLALHERTHSRPVFWRRSAAAAHAALVARTLGRGDYGEEELLNWAMERRGEYFFLSVYRELRESPRWQPEWIDAESLMADAFGRVDQAAQALPVQEVPPTWQERIARTREWLGERGLTARTWLPSPTQGDRFTQESLIPQVLKDRAEQLCGELTANPTAENLLRLSHTTELAGVPTGCGAEIRRALDVIFTSGSVKKELGQAVLAVSARMALISQDCALAEAVADQVLNQSVHNPDDVRCFEVIIRLLQCAAADPDTDSALKRMAQRVENLAFTLPPGVAQQRLFGCLRKLQRLSDKQAPLWARAANIAKLGASPRTVFSGSS